MTPLIFKDFGIWTFDTVGLISLIAALTNAFNGALLARRPSHYKNFTVVGIVILAFAGGIGGGIARDVLLNRIPTPLVNPWYLIGCFAAASLALLIDYNTGEKFKDGLFQFVTAFTLPWYAVVGAQAALGAHLGYLAAIIIGIIATTAGRWIIDTGCQVVPAQLVRGEFFILSAGLTIAVYLVCAQGLAIGIPLSTGVAVLTGFGFRILSLARGWEEWEPWEPAALQTSEKTHKTLREAIKAELR